MTSISSVTNEPNCFQTNLIPEGSKSVHKAMQKAAELANSDSCLDAHLIAVSCVIKAVVLSVFNVGSYLYDAVAELVSRVIVLDLKEAFNQFVNNAYDALRSLVFAAFGVAIAFVSLFAPQFTLARFAPVDLTDEEKVQLRAALDQAQIDLDALTDQYDLLKAESTYEIDGREDVLKQQKVWIDQAEQQMKSDAKLIQGYERENKTIRQQKDDLDVEKTNIKTAFGEAVIQSDLANQAKIQLEKDKTALQAQLAVATKLVSDREGENVIVGGKLSQAITEIENLKKQLSEKAPVSSQKDTETLQKLISEKDEEIAKLRGLIKEIPTLQNNVLDIQTALKTKETEIEKLKKQEGADIDRLNELGEQLKEKEVIIGKRNKEIEDLDAKLTKAEEQVDQVKKELETAQKNDSNKKQLELAKLALKTLKTEIKRLETLLEKNKIDYKKAEASKEVEKKS